MKSFSSDRPLTDPNEDLFEYARFAKAIANGIVQYDANDPLVLGIFGSWGSGKSTALNFVRQYLHEAPDNKAPIIMGFNPWWFSGQENLAKAFLNQLLAVLPAEDKKFDRLREPLSEIAECTGAVLDLALMTPGIGSKFGESVGKKIRKIPRDMATLKEDISETLKDVGKRILIIIDDIDRLTPEETHLLFTTIKALTDFPYVTYLLAFDRHVVVKALERYQGSSAEKFLEKIIQVPFKMPAVDEDSLSAFFLNQLSRKLGKTPRALLDKRYWHKAYYSGIRQLIQVPRDAVRLTNTAAAIYSTVRDEVNVTDFIALEAIRVFLPDLHDTIYKNPEMFLNFRNDNRNEAQKFHKQWAKKIPKPQRASTSSLIKLIFPKTESQEYMNDALDEWKWIGRACHPEVFPIYFRHIVPFHSAGRADTLRLVSATNSPKEFTNILLSAKSRKHPSGLSQVPSLLTGLRQYITQIPESHIPGIIEVFFDIGDELIDPEEVREQFASGNAVLIAGLIVSLMEKFSDDHINLIENAITNGSAIAVGCSLLDSTRHDGPRSASLLSDADIVRL